MPGASYRHKASRRKTPSRTRCSRRCRSTRCGRCCDRQARSKAHSSRWPRPRARESWRGAVEIRGVLNDFVFELDAFDDFDRQIAEELAQGTDDAIALERPAVEREPKRRCRRLMQAVLG